MKFFQVFTMIVMVLATVGVIGESGRGKHVYIALFAAADVLRPELCVGQIEALFGGEAVDRCGLLLAFERIVVGRVGDAQTRMFLMI